MRVAVIKRKQYYYVSSESKHPSGSDVHILFEYDVHSGTCAFPWSVAGTLYATLNSIHIPKGRKKMSVRNKYSANNSVIVTCSTILTSLRCARMYVKTNSLMTRTGFAVKKKHGALLRECNVCK